MNTKRLVLAALVGMFVLPMRLLSADQSEDAWWQQENFVHLSVYYTCCNIDDFSASLGSAGLDFGGGGMTMHGGGFSIGGDHVDKDTHYGWGCTWSFSACFGDNSDCDAYRLKTSLDFYVPFRVSNTLTIYAGAGGTLGGIRLIYDGFDDGEDVEFGPDSGKDMLSYEAFVGLRWRYSEYALLFAEYRREFGKSTMSCKTYSTNHDRDEKFDLDLDANRISVGIGVMF